MDKPRPGVELFIFVQFSFLLVYAETIQEMIIGRQHFLNRISKIEILSKFWIISLPADKECFVVMMLGPQLIYCLQLLLLIDNFPLQCC